MREWGEGSTRGMGTNSRGQLTMNNGSVILVGGGGGGAAICCQVVVNG